MTNDPLWGVLVLLKLCLAPDFVEFVLGRFSQFYIAIVYSNSTICDAWTLSFCESQFQQNEHTPGSKPRVDVISQTPKSGNLENFTKNQIPDSFGLLLLINHILLHGI